MINESIAYITCGCGERFQVLKATQTESGLVIDWDEIATSSLYEDHLLTHAEVSNE
jgi:hypothetical protein